MVILFTDTNAKEIGVYKTCLWHQLDGRGFAMFQIKISLLLNSCCNPEN